MAQARHGSRLYTFLFCIAVFFLTSLGLAVFAYKVFPFYPSLIAFIYLMAWVMLFAFAVDFFRGKGNFMGKKILVLTFGVMLASVLSTHSVWTIVTPSWSFSVSTDKSAYRLGEEIEMTVTLTNEGLITHSFKSLVSDPVLIMVQHVHPTNPTITSAVWFGPLHEGITEFSIGSKKVLERNFTWNQTNSHLPEEVIEQGSYRILAWIPSDDSNKGYAGNYLFVAETRINITAI